MALFLREDEVLRKNLSKRIADEDVVRVQTSGGESIEGVIVGLDVNWIELCIAPHYTNYAVLSLENVTSISKTGLTLEGVQIAGRIKKGIRSSTYALKRSASEELESDKIHRAR